MKDVKIQMYLMGCPECSGTNDAKNDKKVVTVGFNQ